MTTKHVNYETFEVLNPNTKKAQGFIWSSQRYKGENVYDCYETPSQAKIGIDEYWQRFCSEIGGYSYHIPSRTYMQFSVTFLADIDNQLYIFYITKAHNYMIPFNKFDRV